ncbi:sugar transferase [bacterium]|nr:sugar transferase [bacterium]MCI0606478.1 sugar transferase [bacterium]
MMKRCMDFFTAAIMLILLFPILLLISIVILIKLGKPVLYRQMRPGFREKPFPIYKFRTMKEIRDKDGNLLPDHDRLTEFGKWLRSTSLDELPELWNLLRGEMSLVGPRPLLMQYLPRYNSEQRRRHLVKPGITGWAQIHGRNALSWDDKFRLDVWYVDHQSFLIDCKILLITIWKTFKREGIAADGHATMPEFLGSEAVEKANESHL